MTYVPSYKEDLDKTITTYKNSCLSPLSKFNYNKTLPTDIVELLRLQRTLNKDLNSLSSTSLPPLTYDIRSWVNKHYDAIEKSNATKRETIKSNAEQEKNARIQKHQEQEVEVSQYNDSLTQPYQEKHAQLLKYDKKLKHVFDRYDITPMDVAISDNITPEEFETLINKSISVCEKYSDKEENKWFDMVVKPLKGETNLQFTLSYLLIILIVCYVALPIVSIPIFVIMCRSVHNLYKDIEALRIANALMAQVDYNQFVKETDFKAVDELQLDDIEENAARELGEIVDVTDDRAAALKEADALDKEILKTITDVQTEVKSAYADKTSEMQQLLDKVTEEINKFMDAYHPFPTVQNRSVVLDRHFVLGRTEGTIDVRTELPLKNIVFDSRNHETAINLLKLYLANALLAVRVKQLTIEIYDPKDMCKDFTEFFTPETKPFIKPNSMELRKLINTYKEKSQANIIDLDNKDIDTFNKIAEEKEIVPKEYQLLIMVSEFGDLTKGQDANVFPEYMKYSAETGVMVWVLDDHPYPGCIWVENKQATIPNALQYTRELGKQAVDTFITDLANFKDRGIPYGPKFGDVYIPEEKWWTFDTIKGIAMHYGLENGDPTRGIPQYLGDANVHALLGGATGAGKSAAINQMLISLITMYPPSELQIVYIDFKNVEAAKFTQGYDKDKGEWMTEEQEQSFKENKQFYNRLSRIPQLRIISGTTDGEYALSVFEFLMNEMARRQQVINMYGVTKVQEMREQILAKYNTEHNGDPKKGTWADMRKDWDWYKPNVYDKYGDLPRMLIIFDEFQVMYNPEFVETKIIDQINGKITAITKLARAMGCHFWFTSQSMKGTMSKDTMGNFSLRGALRCDAQVSEELLGNAASSTIKAKFGFMYTNDSAGTQKDANRFWRVPFLDEKAMPGYINKLNDMLESHNEKHLMAEFYDEKILVPAVNMETWFTNYGEKFEDPNTFILGERASFSVNKAPVATTLMDDGGENILIAASERSDMMNLALTMLDNLKHKDVTLVINCRDRDTYNLMAIDEIVSEEFIQLSRWDQDVKDLIDALDGLVASREESGEWDKPVYVMLVQWERAEYISVDVQMKVQDQFKALLRRAPSMGVHFIFVSKEKLETPRLIPNACNHRIVGLMPKDSFFFIETSKVEKLPDVSKDAGLFAIYSYGTSNTKFRIYQHTFTRKLKSREVVI